jgi:hypothetical protein
MQNPNTLTPVAQFAIEPGLVLAFNGELWRRARRFSNRELLMCSLVAEAGHARGVDLRQACRSKFAITPTGGAS